MVLPIGGADMPVVISLLNAFTGLSAAAAGFSLDNVALIVAGTLVGSSGTILTMEMATAMNRSVANVLFAGFGGAPAGGAAGDGEERPHRSIGPQDAAIALAYADSVVIVPGYGLAVAQAQHAVKEMADELEKRGVTVSYAIHPVAGRMPGHMNVLLAEADVPYDKLREMDEINPEMPRTDVAVVIGANDVTNPAAKNDPDSPIAGMPIIEVSEAQQVIVIKRSLSPGFAGIDNDLFYEENTSMLFSDAKAAAQEIAGEVEEPLARQARYPAALRRGAESQENDQGVASDVHHASALARCSPACSRSRSSPVLAAPAALGAGYGRGLFTGKANSQFDNDRPKTPIEIKVKGKRARILKAVFLFDCAEDGSTLRRTVETPFKKVDNGAAGGGLYYDGKVTAKEGGEKLDVTFFLGLREKAIRGTGDAYMDVEGSPCSDDIIFKANKR